MAEEPLSRLLKLKTLKSLPQPLKDTVRTLKIQRGACYSRVSGYMSAHLARVKSAPIKPTVSAFKALLSKPNPVVNPVTLPRLFGTSNYIAKVNTCITFEGIKYYLHISSLFVINKGSYVNINTSLLINSILYHIVL